MKRLWYGRKHFINMCKLTTQTGSPDDISFREITFFLHYREDTSENINHVARRVKRDFKGEKCLP